MAIDKLTTTSFLDESVTNLKIAVSARASTVISSASVGDLSDVDITTSSPSSGQTLVWDNANSKFIPGTSFSQSDFDNALTASDTDDLSEGTTNLYYTDARADARVALVIDSAPATLNTLNELASALGDDANFSTTVTNSIADKLPLAGGTMTGNLTLGDNVNLYLGDSSDASLVFDGTDTTLTSQGELILNGQTGITIDCNNVTNQPVLNLSDMGAGTTGILLRRASGGTIMYGQSIDHSRPLAIHGTNKSLGYRVSGSGGNASYAAHDFVIDANASNRHPAVMGVRSANNSSLIFQGEQSDSTVVFSVDYDGNVATSGTVDGRNVATDGTKLDTIETNAKDDQTITAGAGLTGGGTGDVTLSHAATSSQVSLNNSGRTYIQDITLDTYGHITSLATATETVTNTNLTHTGEVTGSTSLTISDNIVDEANLKVSNAPTDGYFLSAQSGNAGGLTWAIVPAGYTDSDVASYLSTNDYDTSTNIIAAITDSAPGTLDTLNELAAALGDDDNFSTTVTNSIATKLPLAGGTMTGDINFGDNDKASFGASNNLEIYYDGMIGSNMVYATSPLFLASTGNIWIGGDNIGIGNPGSSEYFVQCVNNGEVKLYHDNAEKLATTATGIDVTGNVVVSGTVDGRDVATDGTKLDTIATNADVTDTTNVTAAGALMDSEVTNLAQVKAFDSSDYATSAQGTTADAALPKAGGTITGDILYNDNVKAKFGTSNDLEIYHDGSNSYIHDRGVGNLNIKTNVFRVYNAGGTEIMANFIQNGAAELYHDAIKKFATSAAGIDVTGNIVVSGTVDGRDVATDGTKLDGIDASADVTDTANVTSAGALMDSEVTNLAQVKAFDETDYATAAQGTLAGSAVQPNDSPTLGGLTVDGTDTEVLITEDSEGSATLRFADTQADPAQSYAIEYDTSSNKTNFKINNTQRANFNSSGDYMVGPATADSPFVIYNGNNDATKAGVGLRQTGYIGVARMNDHAMMLNRMGSDGLTMGIRNDGTFVGGLGNVGGELTFHDSTSAEAMRLDSSGNLGIGTNNPATALDVAGTVTATAYAGDGSGLTNIARKVWESSQGSGSSANYWAKVATYSISSNFDDGTFIYHFMPEELGAGMPAIVAVNVRTNNASGGDSHTLNVELMSKPHVTPFSDDSFKLIDNGGSSDIELWVKKNDNNCQISAYEMSAHFEDSGFTITYNQNAAWQASEPTGSGLNIKTVGVKVAGNFNVTGSIAVSGTVDGVDVATRDGILTSTTTTANAALPKSGGTMTGDLSLGDSTKIKVGDANELQIYNDGTHTVIAESGPGAFKITADAGLWIQSNNGEFRINTDANGAVALYYDNAIKLATTSTGIDVTGNIVVSGTVDGRDLTTDGNKLDGIETNATADQTKADIEGLSIELPAANLTGTIAAARLSTATTQVESDDSTKIATTAYVTDKITTLIGGAPSTLNDLNELAAAINDDANYNTTLTTALGTKLPLAGGAMTGPITTNSTFDGVDISVRDAVLTSTTTIAAAALPKAGGTMTGDLQLYKATPIITLQRSDNTTLPGLSWQGAGGAEAASIKLDGTSGMTNSLVMSTYNGSTMAERLRLMTSAAGGISVTGNIAVTGTVDGVDIAARDAILTSTTTTAGAALPLAGGTMTGVIAGFESTGIDDNASSTSITLLSSGTVGVGGTSSSYGKLTITQSTDASNGGLGIVDSGNALSARLFSTGTVITLNAGNTGTGKLVLNAGGGNVGIGTESPQKKLEVTGDLQLDADNASIWLKSGVDGTAGKINWTYNSEGTVYASAGIDYDTRASTGFHLDVGYPITLDTSSSTGIKFITATVQRAVINNSGLSVTGNIAVSGTVDGVDIQTLNTTANAALPLAGGTMTGALSISGVAPIMKLAETGVTNNPVWWQVADGGNYSIRLNNTGVYPFRIVTNSTNNAVTNIDMNYNTNFAAGIDVTGNITVTGTVDGVDVAARDGVLTSTTTTANAALPKAGGTVTGLVTFNAGQESQAIYKSGATNFDSLKLSGAYSLYNVNASGHTNAPFQYGAMITAGNTANSGGMAMQLAHERTGTGTYIRGMNDSSDTWYDWEEIWTSGTDGSGSGLDADLLDGQQGSYYQKKTTVQDAAPSGATGDLWYESDTGSFYVYYSGAWVDVAPGVETNTNLQINSLGVGTAASGTAGEIRATNDVTAYYSDERLKDFHGNIDSALDKVNQLNGYYFTENETAKELGYDNDKRQVGVSAQEVQAVLPEVVAAAPISDEYLTVKYEKLAPLFIEAIKEIDKKYQDKIDMLMEEIEKLKGN